MSSVLSNALAYRYKKISDIVLNISRATSQPSTKKLGGGLAKAPTAPEKESLSMLS